MKITLNLQSEKKIQATQAFIRNKTTKVYLCNSPWVHAIT